MTKAEAELLPEDVPVPAPPVVPHPMTAASEERSVAATNNRRERCVFALPKGDMGTCTLLSAVPGQAIHTAAEALLRRRRDIRTHEEPRSSAQGAARRLTLCPRKNETAASSGGFGWSAYPKTCWCRFYAAARAEAAVFMNTKDAAKFRKRETIVEIVRIVTPF